MSPSYVTRSQGAAVPLALPLTRCRTALRAGAPNVDDALRRGCAGMPLPLPGGRGFLRVIFAASGGRGLAAGGYLPAGTFVARFCITAVATREQWPALERAGHFALDLGRGRLAVVAAPATADYAAVLINSSSRRSESSGGGGGLAATYAPPNCRISVRNRDGVVTGRVYTTRGIPAHKELLTSYHSRGFMRRMMAEARAATEERSAAQRERRVGWTTCALCSRRLRVARAAFHANAHRATAARRGGAAAARE